MDRSYRFLFRNIHDWYHFTEAFRHIHKNGEKEGLFQTNEGYLKFVIAYIEDQNKNKYEFNQEDSLRVIESRSDSGDESTINSTQYQKDRAPDTVYSTDSVGQNNNPPLKKYEGDKFNPNNVQFD